ncbi:MAG: hypothetical protein V3V08_01755, partial [Nannocystaceae bacterium]
RASPTIRPSQSEATAVAGGSASTPRAHRADHSLSSLSLVLGLGHANLLHLNVHGEIPTGTIAYARVCVVDYATGDRVCTVDGESNSRWVYWDMSTPNHPLDFSPYHFQVLTDNPDHFPYFETKLPPGGEIFGIWMKEKP